MRTRHTHPGRDLPPLSELRLHHRWLLLTLYWLVPLSLVTLLPACSTASHRVQGASLTVETTKRYGHVQRRSDELVGPPAAPQLTEEKTRVTSQGASANASGAEINQNFVSSPPEVQIPGALNTKGGKSTIDATVIGGLPIIPILCGLAAVLSLAGAGYLMKLGRVREATYAAALGGIFFVCAVWPELVALALVACLGLFVVWVLATRTGIFNKEALRAVVAGVEASPSETQSVVKQNIKMQADERDRKTIARTKFEDGL